MSDKKVITVFGATGAQGGGLVRAMLEDPNSEFTPRAVTRDLNSEKAQALAKAGAEVVVADVDDPDSISNALRGAYGAYFVTFFWDHFSPERELSQAASFAKAAKENGLQHVIWSTLEDTRKWVPLSDDRMPTLMEKYKVPHFDAKGEADQQFRDQGVPTTFLVTSFYWDNMIHFGMEPKAGPDGTLAITLPMGDKKLPGIAAEDIGRAAYGIFQAGQQFVGKTVGVMGEALSGEEMASELTKSLGKQVKYNEVEPETFRSFGFPGADDLGNMFQFKRDFNDAFVGARSVELTKQLNPKLQSFSEWLDKNANRIPIA